MNVNHREKKIKERFKVVSKECTPRPNLLRDCIRAFWVGGTICLIGELIGKGLIEVGVKEIDKGPMVSLILVFSGALLTGLGIYDKIASFAGAGTIVPITGFANAVVAPAIEYKKEGFVFGVASKICTIAGPVIVYGTCTSVIIGIIYYIVKII